MGLWSGVAITFIGVAGLVLNRNVVMKIVSLDVMNVGVIFFFVSMSYRPSCIPPVIFDQTASFADPVPQAVIITAIVIGFSVISLSVALTAMLIEETRRVNSEDMERLMRS